MNIYFAQMMKIDAMWNWKYILTELKLKIHSSITELEIGIGIGIESAAL